MALLERKLGWNFRILLIERIVNTDMIVIDESKYDEGLNGEKTIQICHSNWHSIDNSPRTAAIPTAPELVKLAVSAFGLESSTYGDTDTPDISVSAFVVPKMSPSPFAT